MVVRDSEGAGWEGSAHEGSAASPAEGDSSPPQSAGESPRKRASTAPSESKDPLPANLMADYQVCQEIIRANSSVFYTTFSRLPPDRARALYAVYAFCRMADDAVDNGQNLSEKESRIKTMEQKLSALRCRDVPQEPLWRALSHAFSMFPLQAAPFFDQIQGQRQDVDFAEIRNIHDLKEYSYYVAGSVALMLLPILASDNHAALSGSAIDLGIAMQITNILRDVGEDMQKYQRVYLPSDLMRAHRYTPEDIRLKVCDSRFVAIWEALAREAETMYDRSLSFLPLYDEVARGPLESAALGYRSILDAVRESGYDCLDGRWSAKSIHSRLFEA